MDPSRRIVVSDAPGHVMPEGTAEGTYGVGGIRVSERLVFTRGLLDEVRYL